MRLEPSDDDKVWDVEDSYACQPWSSIITDIRGAHLGNSKYCEQALQSLASSVATRAGWTNAAQMPSATFHAIFFRPYFDKAFSHHPSSYAGRQA
jgi:hypothetical protein